MSIVPTAIGITLLPVDQLGGFLPVAMTFVAFLIIAVDLVLLLRYQKLTAQQCKECLRLQRSRKFG